MRARLALADDPALTQALSCLDSLPAARAVARGKLLAALLEWREEQRSGTRRDFALFARGTTKAISDAEWRWLEDSLDPADFGIERHTPLLLLSAPLVLIAPAGRLDLAAPPDFCAITPQTLAVAHAVEHIVERWRVVENRTSFERVARGRERDTGVMWLPGFPPAWWREAVTHLLHLAPAPAEIACDPDPAGIEIACQAGKLWTERNLPWTPWQMEPERLTALPTRIPLTPRDRERLLVWREGSLPPRWTGSRSGCWSMVRKASRKAFCSDGDLVSHLL